MQLDARARVFGDNINTDYVIASTRKRDTLDGAVLKRYLLEAVDPAFAATVQPGDVLVAGRNFGCGSAMEVAATVILAAGIPAVLARTFARTFYRNAINDGLTIVECPELYAAVAEGDRIAIELASGRITHQGGEYAFPQMPDSVRRILELGGLANYLKANLPAGS